MPCGGTYGDRRDRTYTIAALSHNAKGSAKLLLKAGVYWCYTPASMLLRDARPCSLGSILNVVDREQTQGVLTVNPDPVLRLFQVVWEVFGEAEH